MLQQNNECGKACTYPVFEQIIPVKLSSWEQFLYAFTCAEARPPGRFAQNRRGSREGLLWSLNRKTGSPIRESPFLVRVGRFERPAS